MIFVDFDGTLIDLWPRYHAVFSSLLELDVSLHQYKKIKQRLVLDEKVAEFFGKTLNEKYFIHKAELLERKDYLALDKLVLSPEIVNDSFDNNHSIVLTKRRNPENFAWELDSLGLKVVSKVLTHTSKKNCVANDCHTEKSIVIGDSLADLEVASLSYVKAYMVLYGLGTVKQFDSRQIPYSLISSPNQIIDIMEGYHHAIS